jgi:hypothetical protein
VTLAIAGGTSAVAGSSTVGAATVAATATSAANATLTLSEAFTSGSPGSYTIGLACTRARDGAAVAVTGSGLSRSITMPNDSAVACAYSNSLTVPLTLVKLVRVVSDPINGTTRPKAIPGAVVEYEMIVANPAANPSDANSVVLTDAVPPQLQLRVADLGGAGTGPVAFANGSPASGLAYTFTSLSSATDDVAFSSDGGATWNYTPVPSGGDGIDPAVTNIRINPKGVFNANNAQFRIRFRARLK